MLTSEQEARKDRILTALGTFAGSRSGLDWRDYGDAKAYRAEQRAITKDLHVFRTLLGAVRWRGIDAVDLVQAFRDAYSGRLNMTEGEDGRVRLDYHTGQYYPTEYRRAACAVLASALWAYKRDHCMPETLPPGVSAGQHIRDYFKREFGRGIARRFFD